MKKLQLFFLKNKHSILCKKVIRMNKIKKYRKKKGFSQSEIAKKLNIKQNTFSQWETDFSTPNVRQAIRLAEILDTTVESLYK